jgi:hypothetical protein
LAQRVIARWSTSPPEADKPRPFGLTPFKGGFEGSRLRGGVPPAEGGVAGKHSYQQ